MNKQRNVLITITYNEMGIIIDTKTEEVAQPNLQPTCNQLATDCISRKDAIDAVVELCKHYTPTKSVKHPHIDFVIEELNNVPSAPLERKKGKWQWCGNHHLCSECDEWALTRWDEDECDEVDILTDFCPNCGADMRGEEE